MVEVRMLEPGEASLLNGAAPGVFDESPDPRWTAEFAADSRHHLAVALDAGLVVGMASGVHYVHPDKPPQLWINEVGVSPAHQGQGLGKRLVAALLDRARALGCTEAWVLTETENAAAQRMYRAAGGCEEPARPVMFTFTLAATEAERG
jgi:ribosomal protein S18 acetylase RimI-like enzyme